MLVDNATVDEVPVPPAITILLPVSAGSVEDSEVDPIVGFSQPDEVSSPELELEDIVELDRLRVAPVPLNDKPTSAALKDTVVDTFSLVKVKVVPADRIVPRAPFPSSALVLNMMVVPP